MKKNLIALAVLAVASSAALAQSSVTLFGVADAAVKYGRTSDTSKTTLGPGAGLSSNRLGFSGVEDLGAGLKAGFWLEAGYGLNDGAGQATSTNNQTGGDTTAGGLAFNRRATLSLMGNFGEVRLGRTLAATYTVVGTYDPTSDVGVGSTILDSKVSLSSITRGIRVSNSVNYFTPANLGGVYAHAQYYFGGNSAASTATVGKSDGTGMGLRVGYAQGPLDVSFAVGSTKYVAAAPNPVYVGDDKKPYAGDERTANAGASYDFGSAKLFAAYNQDKIKGVTGDQKGQGYLLGVSAPFGASKVWAAYSSYTQKLVGIAANPQANKFAVGYVYDLSKRTSLYSTVALLKNKNGAGQTLNGSSLVSTNLNGNSTGIDVGIKHSF